MQKEYSEQFLFNVSSVIDTLFSLETLLELTKEYCLKRDFESIYYSLSSEEKVSLSEERNRYICLLNIALEKLNTLKQLNLELEDKFLVL